jgi:starch-binding outer membrane protein, SusD/RagB family
MKNKNYIIIALFASVLFGSCKDFLTDQPESVLTQVDFYNTPQRINQGVLGCYAGMASATKDEWKFTEMRSDNTCVANIGTQGLERVDYCDLDFFRTSTSLPMLQAYWYKLFQNISNVNAILPSVTGNTYLPIEEQRAQFEAELLFIRAFHYFTLVNLWGDMFKVTSVISAAEAKKIPRSPAAQIYNEIIIPDLIKAASQAPSSYPTKDVGRITKWAAKSLLAKAYMTLGGADNLAKAKPLLEEVLTASPHGLLTGTGAYAKIFDVTNEMNKEIIFAVRYTGGSTGLGSPFWGTFAPDNSGNKFLVIGTPAGDNNPTFEIMSLFRADPKDTRGDASCRIWFRSTTDSVYYISKFIDPAMILPEQSENDWPVIRYADVILLNAEVMAQDGRHNQVHIELNKTRERAGLTPITTPFSSKTQALDEVYKERRLELAFENQRWFDLLRMGKAYDNPNKAVEILKTHTFVTDWIILYSRYQKITVPAEVLFIADRLLLPVPQTEIDTNNEMVIPQNKGY